MSYFDYAATTPLDPQVFEKMKPFFDVEFGNASAVHRYGQQAQAAVDTARRTIAQAINAPIDSKVVFTSGATESNNLALLGSMQSRPKAHIIVTAIEHESVLAPIARLEQEGYEVTYIKPTHEGVVEVNTVRQALRDNTALVSCMYVNNETGSIQPVVEIGKVVQEANQERSDDTQILFHCDAAQAARFMSLDVRALGLDFLTLSAHKMYGPKSVGALYIRDKTTIKPQMLGGGQEYGLRSGTHNVPGIVGMGAAQELVASQTYQKDLLNLKKLHDYTVNKLTGQFDSALNGSHDKKVAGIINIAFKGVAAEELVILLDQEGSAVSYGSACSAGAYTPSHVLRAMNLPAERIASSIRISLSPATTKQQVAVLLRQLEKVVKKLS